MDRNKRRLSVKVLSAVLLTIFLLAATGVKPAAADDCSFCSSQEMQEMSQVFNMQYLMLQQSMQNDNRQYTTLSNVMKAKHDTAKNALENLQ